MAYYERAPKKRVKTDYAQKGSWDEEGSHYRNGGSKNAGHPEKKSYSKSSRNEQRLKTEKNKNPFSRQQDDKRESFSFSKDRPGARRFPRKVPMSDTDKRREIENRNESNLHEGHQSIHGVLQAQKEQNSGYLDYEYSVSAETAEQKIEQDYILCGRNPIREALRSGREIEKLLVQKGELSGSAKEIVQAAREKKIMVQEIDKRRLDELAPHHQGLIAIASAYEYASVDDILSAAKAKKEAPFIVVLDGVTDPHNLGAIIRTAECVGAHGVIIPLHRSVGLTPTAVKASAGAVEHIKVARVTNLNRTIEELKHAGIWIYALTMDGEDYEKVDFHAGTALVIGAEGDGISRLTAEKCDMAVSLPMRGKLDSLNASVAAGVAMYRVLNSRRSRK